MQARFTAKELAALKVQGYPATNRGIQNRATSEGWKSRRFKTRGGWVIKYYYDFLPEPIRIAIAKSSATPDISSPNNMGFAAGVSRATEISQDNAVTRTKLQLAKERALAAFARLPENKQQEAYARLDILHARDGFIRAASLPLKRGSQQFCMEFSDGNINLPEWVMSAASRRKILKLSWSSLNRWQQAYDDQGLPGLINGYKAANKGVTSLTTAHQSLVEAMLIKHPESDIKDITDAIAARFDGQELPHRSSIDRFVKAWKKQHASLWMYIISPDEWRNKHMAAGGKADEKIVRLNQVWEFDSTPADVMLQDGRHAIVGVIDVFSRRAKLQVTPTSRSTAIAAITRRAIIDWGVPETAKTDNGKDYISKHLTRVFDELGIWQDLCREFHPEDKPHIERFLGTFSHSIVKLLPGYIGHDVAARKKIEARKSFAHRFMKSGEEIELQITAAELQQVCDDWVEAYYHQEKHSSLGMTPMEKAISWTEPIRKITNERALDILLSEAPNNNGIRRVGKKGIEVDNTFYDAPELAGYEGRQIRVLLDADYGVIYAFFIDGLEAGQFLCAAVDPDRTGHDRAEIASRRKALQEKIYRQGRKEFKKDAREQAVEEIHREILEHRKSKIANIKPFPQKSTNYSTPALDEAALAAESMELKSNKHSVKISQEEIKQSEQIIAKADRKAGILQAFPNDEFGAYQLLLAEDKKGLELSDKEHRWLAEYDLFSTTGKRTGLVKEEWQPYAERARIAREAAEQ